MTIYTSEKAMPYVYMGIHKETGEFYIGSRTTVKQTLPSHEDILHYRTSSKKVKPIFGEFDWIIIAEFFDPVSAYDYEQDLIQQHWGNSLLLNGNCVTGGGRLLVTGVKWSAERKARSSAERKGKTSVGRKHSLETRMKMSQSYSRTGFTHSEETKQRLSLAHTGKTLTPEHVAKIKAAKVGRTWWNNTVTSTLSVNSPGDGWMPGRLPLAPYNRRSV
jgi:hypothetical protein